MFFRSTYIPQSEKAFGVTVRVPNFVDKFIKEFSDKLKLTFVSEPNARSAKSMSEFTSDEVFAYAYAVFHSLTYRIRYAEFLEIDFPRLPLTTDTKLFRKLCGLGSKLVAGQLLEGVGVPRNWNLTTDGSTLYEFKEVAAGFPKYEDDKVFINKTAWFDREMIDETKWAALFTIG